MAHNIDSMMYTGEMPWHGLGKKLERGARSEQQRGSAALGLIEPRRLNERVED